MKKINVKPVEILKLQFQDGVTKDCKFSAYAMMILDEEFGGFTKTFKEAKEKPFLSGAKLLYAGMKACDENVTFKEAKAVVTNLNIDDILEIFDFVSKTIEVEKVPKKKLKNIPQDHKKKKKK